MTSGLTVGLFALLSLFSSEPEEKGTLFIIGGGDRVNEMTKFVDLSGGKDARIVVIPMAGEDFVEDWLFEKKRFAAMGCTNIVPLITDRAGADADSTLAKLDGAKGVFFTGGDQVRLTKIFLGTKAYDRIRTLYLKGACIGGTSAGAAIMSRVMITGEEKINKDSTRTFWTIEKDNVEAIEGFGLIRENIIIDQHFVVRKRLNRLISTLLDHPGKIGIGIDESTVLIVYPDDTAEVFGGRNVVIVNATGVKNIATTDSGLYAGQGMTLDVLKAGDKYDLKSGRVIR
ncbi:MAG: cyanophycinase [Bacteroidetes bacterium]|nr:cyanophycinase [Bacteroidota bacterium]